MDLTCCEVCAQFVEAGFISSQFILDARGLRELLDTATETFPLLLYVAESLFNFK
jgi:hypothetical protein